jgi:hypothetical protein
MSGDVFRVGLNVGQRFGPCNDPSTIRNSRRRANEVTICFPKQNVAGSNPVSRLQTHQIPRFCLCGFVGLPNLRFFPGFVGPPARELLSLLGEFVKGGLPSKGPPKVRLADAQEAMLRNDDTGEIESTVMPNTPLDWLLHPDNRPQRAEARPSIEGP